MTRNTPPSLPNGKPWPDEDRTLRDVYAQFRTNLGETVEWKSWGTGGSVVVGHVKKYCRYPRAFLCLLKNNHEQVTNWGDDLGVFDLYDIGAQRNHDAIIVYVTVADGEDCDIVSAVDPNDPNFKVFPYHPQAPQKPLDPAQQAALTVPTPVPNSTLAWYIPPAMYTPTIFDAKDTTRITAFGAPTNPAWLRFTGDSCEIRVYRDKKDPKKGDGGDDDGAPPPPDPGDDGSEVASFMLKLKQTKAMYEELKAKLSAQ